MGTTRTGRGAERTAGATEEKLRLQKRILGERVKELECLLTVSRIFNSPSLSLPRTLEKLCEAIRAAWQFPAETAVRIQVRREDVRTAGYRPSQWKIRLPLSPRGSRVGSIEVGWLGAPPVSGASPFLPAERRLLRAVAELTENVLTRTDVERDMKRTAARLQEQKRQLERKNIALKEVLAQIELEKREIRERISADIGATVTPLLHALSRPGMPAEQRQRYLRVIERSLADIDSSAARPPAPGRGLLSPREAEVADLVRSGATSKEIARLLHVAEATVERHRHNIRRKTGIGGRKVNLATYLGEGA